MGEEGKGEMGTAGRSRPGSREEKEPHRHSRDRQTGAGRQLRGPGRGEWGQGRLSSSWGPVSPPQDRAGCQAPARLA